MKELLRPTWISILLAVVTVGAAILPANKPASARPQYSKAFFETYPDNKAAAALEGNAKCSVCHPGANKKMRNDYGESLGKLLGAKNEKNDMNVKAALKKNEAEKSSVPGKTFGDLLKAGGLPGK
jgi:hypothetical protein